METEETKTVQRVTLDLPLPLYERLRETAYSRRARMSEIGRECLDKCLPKMEQRPRADAAQE